MPAEKRRLLQAIYLKCHKYKCQRNYQHRKAARIRLGALHPRVGSQPRGCRWLYDLSSVNASHDLSAGDRPVFLESDSPRLSMKSPSNQALKQVLGEILQTGGWQVDHGEICPLSSR